MFSEFLVATRTVLFTLLVTGIVYPLVMTGIVQLVAGHAADGSLVADSDGQVVGSELIGQPFANPAYFQPRPSAAGAGYDATASGGSNLGPTSLKLRQRVEGEIDRLRQENPEADAQIPVELVTASGSGLDPHVSPVAAEWQIPRVAAARGISADRVQAIVRSHEEGRSFGILGEPRVNVLLLNLALDRQFGKPMPVQGS